MECAGRALKRHAPQGQRDPDRFGGHLTTSHGALEKTAILQELQSCGRRYADLHAAPGTEGARRSRAANHEIPAEASASSFFGGPPPKELATVSQDELSRQV